jgi:protein SCO1/2
MGVLDARGRGAGRCLVAGLATLVLTAVAGCGSSAGPPGSVPTSAGESPYQAHVVRLPFAKPAGVFTDTNGKPFDLKKDTTGHPTLLYFGYAHCPDVCPLTMASLGAAVKKLPEQQREDFRVVFITTDPRRDTPKRLRAWLDAFGRDFIGLTGSWHTIARAAQRVHVAAVKPKPTKSGDYQVTHGAKVFGFPPAGNQTYMFSAETPVQDFEHDLPLLAKGVRP